MRTAAVLESFVDAEVLEKLEQKVYICLYSGCVSYVSGLFS